MSANEFLQKITKTQMRSTLAFLNTIGTFSLVYLMFFVKIPAENKDTVYFTVGLIVGVFVTINAFYFGTSKNEADKQKADNEKDA